VKVDGLIDFGDSCLGSPLYEFVFLHLSSFRSNKRQLKAFLVYLQFSTQFISFLFTFFFKDTFYEEEGYDPAWISRICFCFTLLHEFNALNVTEEGYILDASQIQRLHGPFPNIATS